MRHTEIVELNVQSTNKTSCCND